MAFAKGVLFCMGAATSVPSMLKTTAFQMARKQCAQLASTDGLHDETKSCHERNYKCRILQKHDSESLVTIEDFDARQAYRSRVCYNASHE